MQFQCVHRYKINKFGGYRVEVGGWTVDIWPLRETWAFKHGYVLFKGRESLLLTTITNWDAVAFSFKDKQIIARPSYLECLKLGELEIVMEKNPNPSGVLMRVIRSICDRQARILMPRLVKYLKQELPKWSAQEIVIAQEKALAISLFQNEFKLLKLSGSLIGSGWAPTEVQEKIAIRRAVWCESEMIAYMIWSARENTGVVTTRLAADESHTQSFNAIRILLIYLLEQLSDISPLQLNLEIPFNQSHTREVAVGFGFKLTQNPQCLTKMILGKVMTRETWSENSNELADKNNLHLPAGIPTYSEDSQYIQIVTPSGNREHVSLEILESALSPAIFCLPGRPAVITPVQRSFSEPLLG
ncbi:unnamed protein product, partial [Didymodactylos carnosus]